MMSTDATEPVPSPRPADPGTTLLPIARAAISVALGRRIEVAEHGVWLQELGACFVTLMQDGQLRGCIGTLEACRTLLADVKENAVAAAVRDPRFPPLTAGELARTDIEVSVLSPMQALHFDTEMQALAQLRPGIDGLVLEFEHYRSTFLPQVWAQLPAAEEFIAQLKRKAGLPPHFWSEGLRLRRYTVSKWKERNEERNMP
jgi:AmmeMemoRadiSam system protein A